MISEKQHKHIMKLAKINKGKKHPHIVDWNRKFRTGVSNTAIVGEKHWNWKGGTTSERLKIWRSKEYKNWRKSVFNRDDFTCQECGIKGDYIEAHHIKRFAKFPESRFDINNGVTLCKDCHNKTKGKEEELFFYVYIKTIEEVRKHIQKCEGRHVQQAIYSTFHDALTQICFGCKRVRSTIKLSINY